MRYLRSTIAISFLLLGCEAEQHPEHEIREDKNGIYVRDGAPYTGIAYPLTPSMKRESSYETEYNDGMMIRYTTFYDDHKKMTEGLFYGDQRVETFWYSNGQVHGLKGWIHDSLRHGKGYVGLFSGQQIVESNWENGKRHGKYLRWYPNGELHFQKEFQHDIPSGEWTYWTKDREILCSTVFTDGKPRTTYANLNGSDSVSISYFNNGGLDSYTSYKDGIENGLFMEFWEISQIVRLQGLMKSGVKDGEWIRWSEYGCDILSPNYESAWHNNRISHIGSYDMGKEEGTWSLYMYSNSPKQKFSETTFKDGEVHGISRMWDEEGNLLSEKT